MPTAHLNRSQSAGVTGLTWAALSLVVLVWPIACTTPPAPGNGDDPACASDADCADGETCSAAGECVPENIDTNGDGPDDPQPECTVDADCPDGETCAADGTCVADSDPGNGGEDRECATADDCAAGETCTPDGTCIPQAGELPCASDADCDAGEVCSDAGFCAAADDPDPPGPIGGGLGGGGSGGGGGGGPATCTEDADCASGQVCANGLCADDPGEPNFAAALAGCWQLTFTTPGAGDAVAIYEFDDTGQLVRTWGLDILFNTTLEEVRYTIPNVLFWDAVYPVREQLVSLDESLSNLSLSTGLIFFGVEDTPTRCLVQRATQCTDLALIEATLSGSPPDTITQGTFAGSQTCASTVDDDFNFELPLSGTITGSRLAACPDPASGSVQSQEEQGDLCP
jgi:Cys-rich repeat protein